MKTILSKLLILTVLLLLASLPSCVKQPAPKPTPGKDQEQEDDKDDNKPVVETDPARLKFLSFSFAPEHNGQIYSEVALTASGNTLRATSSTTGPTLPSSPHRLRRTARR